MIGRRRIGDKAAVPLWHILVGWLSLAGRGSALVFVFEWRLPVAVLSSTPEAPRLVTVRAASFYRLNFLLVRPH